MTHYFLFSSVNGEISEPKELRDRRMLLEANTTNQLFHRYSPDLAIGGESL